MKQRKMCYLQILVQRCGLSLPDKCFCKHVLALSDVGRSEVTDESLFCSKDVNKPESCIAGRVRADNL